MSDEKTPRPWEAMEPDPNGGVDVCSWGVEPFKTLGTFNPADADLIVTAVNQHDALVAFAEAVRAWDAIFPVSTDVTDALADLDAQIGGN